MVHRVVLNNFQSHKQTKLDFHKNVNIIIGESDNGKSAILRGLYWLIENRPGGFGFVSNWNKTEKGKIKESTDITINIGDEKQSAIIQRFKTNSENGYALNDKQFKAIRTDIPEEVKEVLNLSEINIQKQHDSAFLLSQSGGEIARFFNKIINLDSIDKYLSAIESEKRNNNKNIKFIENEVKELDNKIKKYNWLDKAEKLINVFIKKETKLNKTIEQNQYLNDVFKKYTLLQELIEIHNNVIGCENLIDKTEHLYEQIEKQNIQLDTLKTNISAYKVYVNLADTYSGLQNTTKICREWEKLNKKIIDNKNKKNKLVKTVHGFNSNNLIFQENSKIVESSSKLIISIEKNRKKITANCTKLKEMQQLVINYNDYTFCIDRNKKEIKKLTNELPDICPTCGQSMSKGV